jgi:hypothetical protein
MQYNKLDLPTVEFKQIYKSKGNVDVKIKIFGKSAISNWASLSTCNLNG